MYNRQEAANIKQQFWTTFGQYLSPIRSASGDKINWINYKTGVRFINFKMDADVKGAYFGIEISHKDGELRNRYFERFQVLRSYFPGEAWTWERSVIGNDKEISRISQTLNGVNIFNQADWPAIISFLKGNILHVDEFWNEHKAVFEML